jgi:putative endonuclease
MTAFGQRCTGVTSELAGRVYQHKSRLIDGFTKNYNVNKLVYYAVFADIESAIREEKRIKSGSRVSKIRLIRSFNPKFNDLYESIA